MCGGSGASFIPAAIAAGADAYVTGDVKHHDALDAAAEGLTVIDAGHHGTEWPFVPALAERLRGSGLGDVQVLGHPDRPVRGAVRGMDRLLELQELDISIDRLDARRKEIESGAEVTAAQRAADEVEDRVGTLRLALDSIQREEKRIDHDVGSLEQRIAAEEKRLYDGSVANPKELSSIQAEIANLRKRKSRLEDEELEQMERREEIESKLPPLEAELAEARARLEELRRASGTELETIGSALVDRRAERERLTQEFDEELLDLYQDLRSSKKGVGAAALRDGVCQGCHEKLSAMAIDKLKKTDGIRRCENCRRILILE